MSLRHLAMYLRRYSNEFGSYALGTLLGAVGVGLSMYSAICKGREEVFLCLFLTGASVPIIIHGLKLRRQRKTLYDKYFALVVNEGFSRSLLLHCFQDELLRNVVEEIAEKKGITADYRSAMSNYLRYMGIEHLRF